MKKGSYRFAATLAALVVAAGCSSFDERITAVETRTESLEAQVADLQSAQQNAISRLVELRQEIENSLQPLRTQTADRGEEFRSLQREVTALEEQVAQLQSRIADLTDRLAAGGGAPGDSRVGTPMPPPGGARSPSAGGVEEPADDAGEAGDEADRLFNAAFNDYLRENYDLCIEGFGEYIRRHGSSAMADDAQYWIGECHDARGDAEGAREAYRRLIREYPDSNKIPDAMLNDALIASRQGDVDMAVDQFRRVIQAYPTSDAAFLACRQLEDLDGDLPEACRDL